MRYVAIRIRPRQEEFFADGSRVKHFAVLSNLWEWKPERLIQWHREKAGTIEAVHDVLKNELAGGVMPSKYFSLAAAGGDRAQCADGAEAHRVAGGIIADATEAAAFLIINTAGRIVQHARKMRLRLAALEERIALWKEALRLLPVAT